MFRFKKTASIVVLVFLTFALSTCSGKVDGPADCPVDCGNAINANAATTITPLVPSVSINCHGSVVPKVVELLFKIEAASEKAGTIPRAAISYRPVFNGSYDPGRNDHEEIEYKGIATPKNQWCSSSCGVAKVNLWPQCEEGTTLTHTLYVVSGPAVSAAVTMTMADRVDEGE